MKSEDNFSYLDCIWYVTNLIRPLDDPRYNETACEKYFSFSTKIESPQSQNKSNSISEEENYSNFFENETTELPNIHNTTPYWEDDELLKLNVETDKKTNTFSTTDFEFEVEDKTLDSYITTAITEETSIRETTQSFLENFDAEQITDFQTTFEPSLQYKKSMYIESAFDCETETTTAAAVAETTTTSSFPTTFGLDYSTEKISKYYENVIVETDVKSTLQSNTTQGIMEQLNLTSIFDTTEQIEFYSDFNDSELLNKPDIVTVNRSLCEWYLPTVQQTPYALGNVGIALWVLGFVITFTLIVLFIKQAYFIFKTSHKSYRRHLYSITSIYVVIAILTSIGSGIPRAHAVCSAVKDVYMAIGIGHFMDLTIAMYGGENKMAWHVRDKIINIRVVLICKCFFCIPPCKVRSLSIKILKWIVWQMKWSQAAYYLLKLIIKKASENSLGVSPHEISFWYLHILNVISFLSGVFSLLIVNSLVTDDLQQKYNYTIKAKLVRFTILTTKFQRLFFDILAGFDVFPCYPPYVSQKFYKTVLKDFIYLIEVLILGLITFFVYMKKGEFEHESSLELPEPMLEKENEHPEENGDVELEYTIPLDSRLREMPESIC